MMPAALFSLLIGTEDRRPATVMQAEMPKF